jgi:hypothetical protein
MNFQVSEAARVLTLIYIASYAVRYERRCAAGCRTAQAAGAAGAIALLLLLEPDFGAASVLFITGFGVLFLAGARWRWMLVMLLAAGGCMTLLVLFSSYRMRRMTAFMDPWADPFNSGFQLTQSLIAIGRGGLFGVGLGASVQKLFYLPEAHTDFLFAVLAEELGLFGVAVTLGLFLALAWRAFVIARRANEAGLEIPVLPGLRLRPVAGRAGVHQRRRQHGRAADQGTDAAIHELRPQQPDRDPGLARHPAARAPRDRERSGAVCGWSAHERRRPGEALAVKRAIGRYAAGADHGRRHRRPRVSGAGAGARAARALLAGGVARHAARLEARLVPAEQIESSGLSVSGLRGKGFAVWLRAPLLLRARCCRRWP